MAGAQYLFGRRPSASLLDVGCGTGTWMRAALDLGVGEVFGLDFVDFNGHAGAALTDAARPVVDSALIRRHDLRKPFDLGRKFDVALCLEVGEHLADDCAPTFVESLCAHSDLIYFSAACPGQRGQHHVNCQWPAYWQGLLNRNGFACSDSIRWLIWDDRRIEPWYRQNIFTASKDAFGAGNESRIRPAIHPDMVKYLGLFDREQLEDAGMPFAWYAKALSMALVKKVLRRVG